MPSNNNSKASTEASEAVGKMLTVACGVRDPVPILYRKRNPQLLVNTLAVGIGSLEARWRRSGEPPDCRDSDPAYRGGLAPARLRRVADLVHAKIEDEVTLDELAESAGLSTAHFSQMFRKSTGKSPHQFVLHRRGRTSEGDVAHGRGAGAGCCRGLWLQNAAALCAGVSARVRHQPYRVSWARSLALEAWGTSGEFTAS